MLLLVLNDKQIHNRKENGSGVTTKIENDDAVIVIIRDIGNSSRKLSPSFLSFRHSCQLYHISTYIHKHFKMAGIFSYGTSKWIAPTAFAYNFACQLYGGLSSPNMKDVHDRNLSFFSPNPL
jgi:hypothetical protein